MEIQIVSVKYKLNFQLMVEQIPITRPVSSPHNYRDFTTIEHRHLLSSSASKRANINA